MVYAHLVHLIQQKERIPGTRLLHGGHDPAGHGTQVGFTVSADILKTIISHPMTDVAIAGFEKDWTGVYGNKLISDFER